MRFTREAQEAIAQVALNKVLASPENEFSYAHVAADNHISIEKATALVRGWQKSGLVIVASEAKGKASKLFRVRPGSTQPPRPAGRSALLNIWAAMRGLKTFTAVDLAAHATTETVGVSPEGARAYASALMEAGYLRVERKAVPGKHDAIYRLIKNTGPMPPMLRRVEAVVDLNTGATIVIGGGA